MAAKLRLELCGICTLCRVDFFRLSELTLSVSSERAGDSESLTAVRGKREVHGGLMESLEVL